MKKAVYGSALLALMVASATQAQTDSSWHDRDLIVTASNTASNQLLVYNTQGSLVEQIPTNGAGG
ncbi:MAG TPA: hypothetical protein VMA74_18405, partial [Dyella sp.]|uniref:hypothetical protein n=1 Tax=Dyella sp. TaxID=1869338 RepID=UPI002CAA01CA